MHDPYGVYAFHVHVLDAHEDAQNEPVQALYVNRVHLLLLVREINDVSYYFFFFEGFFGGGLAPPLQSTLLWP